jgi:hypothetical protein
MALFGGQVQTAPYQSPDYGPSVAAYKDLAMAGAQGVSNIAGQVGDYFKQQGEKKKLVKQSSLQIDAALQLFPDLAPSLQSVKERMRDENIPLADRAAEAEVVANLINMGVGEMRNRSNMSFRQDQALADAIYKEQKLGMEERRTRATEFSAMQGAKPTFDLKEATITSPDGKTFKKDIPYDKEKGMFFDPDAGKYIQDINKWGFGEPAYAEDMPPTSQINYDQLPSSNNFGFTSKTRDLLPRSTADARQVSLDFNAAPSKNAKGVEIIIPNDSSAIERAAAMDYVNKTKQYFAERGVEVPVRGVRTAKENGRGTPGRFHTEPFFVGHAEARAVMESDPDGYAQVLADTLGRIPNVTFIAPHKTNDPGASDGKFNERDFAKGSIIPALERLSRGDLSKQAMGTPEQQAEIARMIEQGAGMATAQAAPSGAMPTEPRMAQPQPATQQAPQYQVRPGFAPVGPKGGQKEAKIITGEKAKALNLDPLGTYEASYQDGQLTGVQTIKAAPSVGDIIAMEKREEEKSMQQQIAANVADKSARMVELLTELQNHPGFENLFGATAWPTWISGSPGADAKWLLKQIDALGFMESIKDMKGMGALSNAEGEKASAAFVGINPDMSEDAAKKKITEVIGYIQKGQQRIQSGNLIETKENKGPSISGANSYFNQYKPPAR